MRGKFITVEGPDGAGKTTQITRLSEHLMGQGKKVKVTREPGGTLLGEKLRDLLLFTENPVPEAEALIYAASRAQLVKNVILPALFEGYMVLCDRFVDSSLAYQGWARGLGIDEVLKINKWFLKECWPDLTILLDIDPEVSLKRLKGEKDRLEMENMEFHKKVRQGFLKVHKSFPDRIVIVDAAKSPEQIFSDILQAFDKRL